MADRLIYIRNDDTQNNHFYGLKLVFETFENSIFLTSQSKFKKNPKVVNIIFGRSTTG